jgi:hypothetical protein
MNMNMNKRGFIPLVGLSLGVVIAMVVGILILVGGIFYVTITNKFVIIGSVIIVLSLIYGFKTEAFTKQRGKFVFLFLILGILVFMIGSTPLQQSIIGEKEITYVDDSTIGMITYKVYTPSIWERLLSTFGLQQAAFGQTTAYVGDTITVYDTIPSMSQNKYVNKVVFAIYQNGKRIGITNDVPYTHELFSKKVQVSWTAQTAGTYRIQTELALCAIPGLYLWNQCDTITYTGGSNNQLTVSNKVIPPACTKTSGWSSWSTSENIDNGIIKKRSYTTIDSDCDSEITNNEFKTTCDSGYVISGTQDTSGSGELSCDLKEVPIEGSCSTEQEGTYPNCLDGSPVCTQDQSTCEWKLFNEFKTIPTQYIGTCDETYSGTKQPATGCSNNNDDNSNQTQTCEFGGTYPNCKSAPSDDNLVTIDEFIQKNGKNIAIGLGIIASLGVLLIIFKKTKRR